MEILYHAVKLEEKLFLSKKKKNFQLAQDRLNSQDNIHIYIYTGSFFDKIFLQSEQKFPQN